MKLFLPVLALTVVLVPNSAPSPGHEWHRYSLDLKSRRVQGADISPDNRFIAVYVVNNDDISGAGPHEVVCEMQIWDWREGKLVLRKVVLQNSNITYVNLQQEDPFVRYADGGSKLIVYANDHLLVLDSATLNTTQAIDLETSRLPWLNATTKRPSGYEFQRIADIEIDASARRAAVLIRLGVQAGGELRVYDLVTGSMLRKWEFSTRVEEASDNRKGLSFFSLRPISIDSGGKKIAISLGLFDHGDHQGFRNSEQNVLILEVDSGKTIAAINTGYLAGPICFVPGDTLALATVSEDDYQKTSAKDSIKLWNAHTGELIRELTHPPGGVHYYLDVSANGHVALGYTGHVTCGFSWLGGESGCDEHHVGLRLWDLVTGKQIATFPGTFAKEIRGGLFRSKYIRLSPKGDVILTYAPSLSRELHFYQIE